jgi:hypothetical protein
MTVNMKPAAMWTTLLVYLLILTGNVVALVLLVPLTVTDIRKGPGLADVVGVLVSLVALFLVGIMVINFVRFARLRITADGARVWIPTAFGIQQVARADLAAIRAGRLSSPLARGTRVFHFIRRDGIEAFHVQAALFPEVKMQSLAGYLGVPINSDFPTGADASR